MLNRQKMIVEMLRQAGRPVTKLELVKWAFVLSRETPARGGASFYEFLPYHFGPYSFSLQRELDTLVAEGVIAATEKTWACEDQRHRTDLPQAIKNDIRYIVGRFQNWSSGEVIDYVYRTYPAYTVNSKRERLAERKVAVPAVYTAGYEGLQIDGFLDLLVQSGIRRLIDVRNNPVARRFGFHKSTLDRLCGHLGIEYVHIPELGIVSEERRNLNTMSEFDQLFDVYERTILTTQRLAVERVGELMTGTASVLVCMEAEACRCHRSRLGAEVSRRTKLPIKHLRGTR
ncbi:hypothetical protein ETAA1_08850 [Urbifossiella limnaea]|uniref:DUF488 domain-containing protein n=2 Tax=Urbifossiella limnaea TaxID=2528023 RepID=A0A517XN95_9BACT|nr:hypothetical protein ETAA1_08850 [Urbifossiella limnaea]